MRIKTKVVWLWTCLSAVTFIHTAAAQDYSADPFSQQAAESGVTAADYSGEDPSLDGSPQDGAAGGGAPGQSAYPGVDPGGPGGYGGPGYADPSLQGYPPPMAGPPPMSGPPPGMGYWPQTSPYDTRVRDSTYRENGIWVNESLYGDRKYFMSLEYLRVWFNRPGTDTIGDGSIGIDPSQQGFGLVNAGVFSNGNDLTSDGIRGKFIIQNADNSTFEANGWWTAEGNSVYEPLGRGNSGDANTFRQRGAITYNDGGAGVSVPFDTDFKLGYKEQAFGADLTWTQTPFFETEGFRLKTLFGAKYVKVREQFTFHGEDSAKSEIFTPGGPPIPGSVLDNPLGNPAYASDMVSRTTSDLTGLEAGIRYELGGKKFLLSGQSRFAVAANHETATLYGNQMGDGFGVGFPTPTPTDPKPAYFKHVQSHTHVSPIFQQDFNFKGKVFAHVPLLRTVPMLASADMLVGYNFLLIGDMVRPTQIIDYRVNDPRLNLTYSRWLMQTVTFGLQWQF